jgi:hydrogenase maturation protein HypF
VRAVNVKRSQQTANSHQALTPDPSPKGRGDKSVSPLPSDKSVFPPPSASAGPVSSARRLAITVRGVVQGVGFRPFVYNAARDRGLAGWVRNEADMVRIEVQGNPTAVDAFVDAIRHAPPPQARIAAVEVTEIPLAEHSAFEIRMSEGTSSPRPTIPADLATCEECLAEIRDPSERRHSYPFTNCTRCGPRWSIIERLPYDRPRTSMAGFPMCPECRAEYDDPTDRRFHAQPIACPKCGPVLQLLDADGREIAVGPSALDMTAQLLLASKIVALKGLGGFQLLVDATNAEAVARLRGRKRRPDRPFALMLPTLDDVRQCCHVSDDEARQLLSHQSPIVLLRRRAEDGSSVIPASRRVNAAAKQTCSSNTPSDSPPANHQISKSPNLQISPAVAPGNPYLGVMLPYTPLHHLLMSAVGRPLVCTSGNLSEEPMAIEIDDAQRRLGSIADVLLTHNRPIVRPVDDSIVRVGPNGPQTLRRARGFAPLPIELQGNVAPTPAILAVGGHLKNTVALLLADKREGEQSTSRVPTARGGRIKQLVMSAHVGDLDSVLSVDVFRRAIDDLVEFFQTTPGVVVCDLHPDYASTRHAEELSARWNARLLRVQHHHAHVAACMAEHGLRGPVLGFSWDGTGYGTDGTVWGGESLVCEGARFHRAAHLRTFALPGGDRATREPRRSALGLLFELLGGQARQYAAEWFKPGELDTLLSMLTQGVGSPRTSSMGRLFDAVAAICGLSSVISFEGQAAMSLEFVADESEQGAYPLPCTACEQAVAYGSDQTLVADWGPLVRGVLADRAAGVPISIISARFHNALADMALAIAQSVAPGLPIVLSGGCFQNALLAAQVQSRLSEAGFQVYTHTQVPPGDGGIALGQAFIALQE